jgi:hypothetical protein
MKFEISNHAQKEMNRRAIPADAVEAVLQKPGQILEEYGDKKATNR